MGGGDTAAGDIVLRQDSPPSETEADIRSTQPPLSLLAGPFISSGADSDGLGTRMFSPVTVAVKRKPLPN
jgi:hypothetical protein